MNYAPVARIILRYLSGLTVGGAPLIAPYLAVDPDMVMVTGAIIGFGVEGVYALAKRRGWST